MEQLLPLLIQLISGAIGGNVAGALLKDSSLGTLWNSVAGIVGGALGSYLLNMTGVAVDAGSLDIMSVLSDIASGGIGGAVVMIIAGLIRKSMSK